MRDWGRVSLWTQIGGSGVRPAASEQDAFATGCASIASKVPVQTKSADAAIPDASPRLPRLARARRTAVLKALADPRRFELLERIAKSSCPLGCSDALAALKIAPATLSHHIKELENAGLIDVTREGKFHYLKLKPGVLEALAETLKAIPTASCTPR